VLHGRFGNLSDAMKLAQASNAMATKDAKQDAAVYKRLMKERAEEERELIKKNTFTIVEFSRAMCTPNLLEYSRACPQIPPKTFQNNHRYLTKPSRTTTDTFHNLPGTFQKKTGP